MVADALMMKLDPHCIISNRKKYILLETKTESPSYPENLFSFALFLSCLCDLQNKTLCLNDAGKPTCLRSHCLLFKY